MDNVNQLSLLNQIAFYSRFIKEQEASQKEKFKSLSVQKSVSNSSSKQAFFSNYRTVKNPSQPVTSFNQKYLFQKSENCGTTVSNKRTVVYNQNFKAKYSLSKNQTSKYVSPISKNAYKNNTLSSNHLMVHKKSEVGSEIKSDKIPCMSSNNSRKPTSETKSLIKEIESITELLKKKSSGNQPKLQSCNQSSITNCKSDIQNKLLAHKNYQCSAFNNLKPVQNGAVLSKSENLTKISSKIIPDNIKFSSNSCTRINFNNRNKPLQLKTFNQSKFCYKNANMKQTLNSKVINSPFKTLRLTNQSKSKFHKINQVPHSRRKILSDSKSSSDEFSSKTSILTSTPVHSHKQELNMELTTTNKLVSSGSKCIKESSNASKITTLFKMKSPGVFKSAKLIKYKPSDTKYTKVNKHLNVPNKILKMKYSVNCRTSSSKKTKKKVNSKYKVINKTLTPCTNKKAMNTLNSVGSIGSSPSEIDSDSFLKGLNDSAIDKLEKNLLVMSTALTATPTPDKCNVLDNKILQNNSKLCVKKTPLKKSKTRISKYKIINSDVPRKYSLKKKQMLTNFKTGVKKIKHSNFSLINKHSHPVLAAIPARQEKSILVRRLFKSKSVVINKNASPTNYSAKMIKSKYLTLNKRKSLSWQKHNRLSKVPLHHPKFKGYSLSKIHSKQNFYRKTAISAYHPRTRKFSRNIRKIDLRKVKKGYTCPPVVFIHGMRYSVNSSGKTLKKLPIKGQTTKIFRRSSSKVLVRTPENSVRTLMPVYTNLASRVLHRSINRILTASSKKSLKKVNTYCMFYNRFGRCNRGVKCTYIHDPSKIAVCTRFLRGTCKIDGCSFSHEITPGKMAICSFYLVGACEKENCPYRHEKLLPNAVLCKAFVHGYCPSGKECKKAHILICPKYMQGECDKGSSCAFPHPPQKAKKNVQKDMEDEEKKPDDVLLEKVFRYFQQGGDCSLPSENKLDEKNITNLFVPKQRKKLEQQPSFIPLCDNPSTSHNC